MKYSEEFKNKVLSLEKIDPTFIKPLLESEYSTQLELVGQILFEYSPVSASDIISAYENKNFEGIYAQAKDKLKAEQLYQEWLTDYYPYFYEQLYGTKPSSK